MNYRFYRYTVELDRYFVAVDQESGNIVFRIRQIKNDLNFSIDCDLGESWESLSNRIGIGSIVPLTWSEFNDKAGLLFSTITGIFQTLKPGRK
jgi:hypothetical protein